MVEWMRIDWGGMDKALEGGQIHKKRHSASEVLGLDVMGRMVVCVWEGFCLLVF